VQFFTGFALGKGDGLWGAPGGDVEAGDDCVDGLAIMGRA